MAGEHWVTLTDTSGVQHYVRVDTIDHVQDVAGTTHVQAGGTVLQVAGTSQQLFDKITNLDPSVLACVGYKYRHINTISTTLVKSGDGILQRVILGGIGIQGMVTIYDGLTASGSVIGAISLAVQGNQPSAPTVFEYEVYFTTGLTVVTVATTDVTVVFL